MDLARERSSFWVGGRSMRLSKWPASICLRTWDLSRFYTIEMPNDGQPYAITVDLSGIFKGLVRRRRGLEFVEFSGHGDHLLPE